MYKIFLLLFTVSVFSANAKETDKKKISLKPNQEKKLIDDTTSATHLLFQNPSKTEESSFKKNPQFKTQTTCTDSMGMIHKSSDPGYAGCLRTLDKTSVSSEQKKQSLGITIGN